MRQSTAASRWQQVKGEVRRRWERLTVDDVEEIRGNAERLIELLQQRYGYERARAQREITAWSRSLVPASH